MARQTRKGLNALPKTVCLILLLWPLLGHTGVNSCQTILQPKAIVPPAVDRHLSSNQILVHRTLSPDSSRIGYLRWDVRRLEAKDLEVEVLSYFPEETLRTTITPKIYEELEQGRESFHAEIEQFIRSVMEVYERRRKQWSLGLKDHLVNDAFRFAPRTKFMTVRRSTRLNDPLKIDEPQFRYDLGRVDVRKKSGILGTLRTISADSSLGETLPMEESLKHILPSNGGLKVEVGSLTIDREFNKDAFTQLFGSLIQQAQMYARRPHHEKDKPIFFTYADAQSLRMYAAPAMGWKPVEGMEPVNHEGREWTIIGISAEALIGLPHRLAAERGQWKSEEAAAFDSLVQTFDRLQKPERFEYRSAYLDRGVRQIFETPLTVLTAVTNSVSPGHRTLIFNSSGDTAGSIKISIPQSLLPLKDGEEFYLNGPDEESKGTYRYKNGLLIGKTVATNGNRYLIIKTDPSLMSIEEYQLKWTHAQSRKHVSKVSARF